MSDIVRPKSVLFLCDQNAIRSPMSEHLLRFLSQGGVYCDSAGVSSGTANGFMPAVMSEIGIDASAHEPKLIEELDDTWFDLVVTHSPRAQRAAPGLDWLKDENILHWPAQDPEFTQGSRERILDAYRSVRDSLAERLVEHFGFPIPDFLSPKS